MDREQMTAVVKSAVLWVMAILSLYLIFHSPS